jgi:RNA polymerase sigma-70 factor (ECF subfamily)
MTAQRALGPDTAAAHPARAGEGLDFRAVYETWFDPVCRWLRALGGPRHDVEDLAQEVFVVVRRKLPGFDGENLAGWLYRISANTASDARRRAWFRHLFVRRADEPLEELSQSGAGPAELAERREAERLLYSMLDRLSEKRRRAVILAEIEGYDSDEIARLEGIPAATARTRLHHGRQDLMEMARRMRRREEGR